MYNTSKIYNRFLSTPSYLSYSMGTRAKSNDRILTDKRLYTDNFYNTPNYERWSYNPYYNKYNTL